MEGTMRKPRLTDEQVVGILRAADREPVRWPSGME
jgi:hypothetical protein